MTCTKTLFATAALALIVSGPALASDPPEEGAQERAQDRVQERTQAQTAAQTRSELGLTMRIIDDPEALGGEAVTRRISLPPVLPVTDDEDDELTKPMHAGERVSEQARERTREFGADVAERASERASEMSEHARERREDFGRSRADEARPERPRPPRPPGS